MRIIFSREESLSRENMRGEGFCGGGGGVGAREDGECRRDNAGDCIKRGDSRARSSSNIDSLRWDQLPTATPAFSAAADDRLLSAGDGGGRRMMERVREECWAGGACPFSGSTGDMKAECTSRVGWRADADITLSSSKQQQQQQEEEEGEIQHYYL